jgi:SAM-dependent methyltransferase
MDRDHVPPLRLYRPDAESAEPEPHVLACQELLRPVDVAPPRRGLDPFSRSWFEELEQKRYARNGSWLPRVLEFTRHAGESLVMFHVGLGSDAIQYRRHGVELTICSLPGDTTEKVETNFTLRGQAVRIVPANGPALPFHTASFDLAYVNALYTPAPPADELFRVLRPGGKFFALYPAKYDVTFWRNLLRPWRRWLGKAAVETPIPAVSAKSLRPTFQRFENHRIGKRHLRRAGIPTALKLVPHDLAERLFGEVIVLRAFKPLRAAKQQLAQAA